MANTADVQAVLARDLPNANALVVGPLLDAAQLFLENEVGLEIFSGPQSYTQVENGSGKDRLVLKRSPIISVTSVTVGTLVIPPVSAGDTTSFGWLAPTDDGVLYLRGYLFSRGIQNVVIPLSYGYKAPPPDIWNVSIELVARKYRRMSKPDMQSIAVQGETTTFIKDDLTPMEVDIVHNYQRWL